MFPRLSEPVCVSPILTEGQLKNPSSQYFGRPIFDLRSISCQSDTARQDNSQDMRLPWASQQNRVKKLHLIQMKMLDLFVERGAVDVELLGGFLTVPVVGFQGSFNDLAFRVF